MVARKWPKEIIRSKGLCYFSADTDKCYLFETAGQQKTLKDAGYWFATMPRDELAGVQQKLTEAGLWYATAPEEDLVQLMEQDPSFMRDWDPEYGDRMNKIVFIGQHLDKEAIESLMDSCLAES